MTKSWNVQLGLLANKPLIVQATSALDSVSERLVQGALNHLMKVSFISLPIVLGQ
jgi:ABC-type multidrug transport system fused ATPase/permease subunit